MKNEMKKIDCKSCREHLADLLLDESYAAKRPEVSAHCGRLRGVQRGAGGVAVDVCAAG